MSSLSVPCRPTCVQTHLTTRWFSPSLLLNHWNIKTGQIRTHCPLTCCPRTRAPLILRACLYTHQELHTNFLLLRCVRRCVWWAVRGRGACVFFGGEQWGPLLHHLPIHSLTDPPPFGKRRSLCVCASEAAPVSPSVPRGIQ